MVQSTLPIKPVENWEQVRDEWVAAVERLTGDAESWARGQGWAARREPKTVMEDRLGQYAAPRLLIHSPAGRLLLDPIARYVPGARRCRVLCLTFLRFVPDHADGRRLAPVRGRGDGHSPALVGVGLSGSGPPAVRVRAMTRKRQSASSALRRRARASGGGRRREPIGGTPSRRPGLRPQRRMALPRRPEPSRNLEGTFLLRLFAEFESGTRDAWLKAFGRTTHPPTRDLLEAVARLRLIPQDWLDDAHEVREYRNRLVHEGDDRGDAVSVPEAHHRLCRFFSWLPLTW